jgi:Domain of unknown function (DU1801)
MAKNENKTKPTRKSVEAFIDGIRDEERRADCRKLIGVMQKATGEKPRLWGSMVGFGSYHYRYASGRAGDIFRVGFASRKPDLVLYLACGKAKEAGLLAKLGKHREGVGCLYIRRLADVDERVVEKLVAATLRELPHQAA